MKQNNLKVVGITGGIASGKSTVVEFLTNNKFSIIDADIIARQVVEIGTVGIKQIEEYFGKAVINDNLSLNRKALRNIVFNDKSKLEILNEITHPLIIKEIENQIQYFRKCNDEKVVFLDCPLLFEMKLQYLTDTVWLISTTLENQISRIIKRDNVDISEASRIISYQMSLNEKIEKSDIIIENNDTKKELLEKIKKILIKEKC